MYSLSNLNIERDVRQQCLKFGAKRPAATMEDDEWGEFAISDTVAPATAQFSEGQLAEYRTRRGDWIPTKVRPYSSFRIDKTTAESVIPSAFTQRFA